MIVIGAALWRAILIVGVSLVMWRTWTGYNSISKFSSSDTQPISQMVVDRQPAIFIGHGSPMLALKPEDINVKAWKKVASEIPRPKAILAISAHWYVGENCVLAQEKPRTIHDFGNFPQELYDVEYPSPGSPELAERVAELIAEVNNGGRPRKDRDSWGLDHGTWSVLRHMYPDADIPVIQLSIDSRKKDSYHYKIGRQLSKLRDEGVLIFGSGNLVHNFAYLHFDKQGYSEPLPWAAEYVEWIKGVTQDESIDRDDIDNYPVVHWKKHKYGIQSQNGPDHFLPSLYILGAAGQGEKIRWFTENWDLGSLSMGSFIVGHDVSVAA